MANEQERKQDPTVESDVSKAQSQQQPPQAGSGQQRETGQFEAGQNQDFGQSEAGPPDEGLQGETATQRRTDIEGASLQAEKGEAESGFVGSKGEKDASGEFVERKDENEEGSTPEGK